MTEKQRRSVLYAALAGVAAWSIWLAFNEPANEADLVEVAEPVAHTTPVPAATEAVLAVAPMKPQPATPRLALARANLFPRQSWYVAPPPPPPPPPPVYVPPPPPQAPALPYSYMGRWKEADQITYYLARGTLPVSVRPGEVLDGVWRMEPVSGSLLNFTYLPLNQTRSLRTGD